MTEAEHTIVLTLLEGRHFPRRPGVLLVAEGRFDSEALAADPVSHDAAVAFHAELVGSVEVGLFVLFDVHRARRLTRVAAWPRPGSCRGGRCSSTAPTGRRSSCSSWPCLAARAR